MWVVNRTLFGSTFNPHPLTLVHWYLPSCDYPEFSLDLRILYAQDVLGSTLNCSSDGRELVEFDYIENLRFPLGTSLCIPFYDDSNYLESLCRKCG